MSNTAIASPKLRVPDSDISIWTLTLGCSTLEVLNFSKASVNPETETWHNVSLVELSKILSNKINYIHKYTYKYILYTNLYESSKEKSDTRLKFIIFLDGIFPLAANKVVLREREVDPAA